MLHVKKNRLVLTGSILALAGLLLACESDVERQMRLEREALEASGELEDLEGQLNTVNPDPYDPNKTGTKNIGRFKQN